MDTAGYTTKRMPRQGDQCPTYEPGDHPCDMVHIMALILQTQLTGAVVAFFVFVVQVYSTLRCTKQAVKTHCCKRNHQTCTQPHVSHKLPILIQYPLSPPNKTVTKVLMSPCILQSSRTHAFCTIAGALSLSFLCSFKSQAHPYLQRRYGEVVIFLNGHSEVHKPTLVQAPQCCLVSLADCDTLRLTSPLKQVQLTRRQNPEFRLAHLQSGPHQCAMCPSLSFLWVCIGIHLQSAPLHLHAASLPARRWTPI